MKMILRVCTIVVAIAIVAVVIHFFISGALLIRVLSLLVAALMGVLACEQIRSERGDGRQKSRRWLYFCIFVGALNLAAAVVMTVLLP
ncbi:MAG: hypothetical protein FWC96_03715 [Oscillospiraceae bacterium]|nr:hypothetical protein [Oscillospiraceae bacterium]